MDDRSWSEEIQPVKQERLPKFLKDFTDPKLDTDSQIFSVKAHPGIDLILPKNTTLTAQQVAEAIKDIAKLCRPAAFMVKPNPTKS